MLDKSVEYRTIAMLMEGKKVTSTPEATLPEGFSFRLFNKAEDAAHWARIEASVLEFDNEDEAEQYFTDEFIPHIDELKRRCIFIQNKDGQPIATAMGWYSDCKIPNRLHWVAVCPEYQGLGLGKAVSQKAINVCAAILPDEPMWLRTQTHSHRAVLMYHKLGFNMVKNKIPLDEEFSYAEDYNGAIEILTEIFRPEEINALQETAL